ncbi:MAG: hypothetical protein M0Z80_11620 [Treponema sp.]|nr:hypothetical protein [Treponema sp.]
MERKGAAGQEGSRLRRGYAYIALTTLLFNSMEIALKSMAGRFNPVQLTLLRFLAGGLLLLPFAAREPQARSWAENRLP